MIITLDRMVEKELGVFSSLTDNELFALENSLAAIDLQSGCSHQCLGCGADAPPAKYHMQWENLVAISRGIKILREKKGIELLPSRGRTICREMDEEERNFRLFRKSDIAHYRSIDAEGNERTCYDAGKLFFNDHGRKLTVTTAGWKPGDNYMEGAMKGLASNMRVSFVDEYITYSLKPFSILMRTEFDNFFGKKIIASEEDFTEFFDQSGFVRQVIANLNTIGKKGNLWIQYLGDIENLPTHNFRYTFLFSKEVMSLLGDYCLSKINTSPMFVSFDSFAGIGRANEDFGLKSDTMRLLGLKDKLSLNNFVVNIDYSGTMNVVYRLPNKVAAFSNVQNILLEKADYYKGRNEDYRRTYSGLASLNGKNLFDGGK